jgi:hypothetical protein
MKECSKSHSHLKKQRASPQSSPSVRQRAARQNPLPPRPAEVSEGLSCLERSLQSCFIRT